MTIIIKTTVKCPQCSVELCNLCGFNGRCAECDHELSDAVLEEIAKQVEERLGV